MNSVKIATATDERFEDALTAVKNRQLLFNRSKRNLYIKINDEPVLIGGDSKANLVTAGKNIYKKELDIENDEIGLIDNIDVDTVTLTPPIAPEDIAWKGTIKMGERENNQILLLTEASKSNTLDHSIFGGELFIDLFDENDNRIYDHHTISLSSTGSRSFNGATDAKTKSKLVYCKHKNGKYYYGLKVPPKTTERVTEPVTTLHETMYNISIRTCAAPSDLANNAQNTMEFKSNAGSVIKTRAFTRGTSNTTNLSYGAYVLTANEIKTITGCGDLPILDEAKYFYFFIQNTTSWNGSADNYTFKPFSPDGIGYVYARSALASSYAGAYAMNASLKFYISLDEYSMNDDSTSFMVLGDALNGGTAARSSFPSGYYTNSSGVSGNFLALLNMHAIVEETVTTTYDKDIPYDHYEVFFNGWKYVPDHLKIDFDYDDSDLIVIIELTNDADNGTVDIFEEASVYNASDLDSYDLTGEDGIPHRITLYGTLTKSKLQSLANYLKNRNQQIELDLSLCICQTTGDEACNVWDSTTGLGEIFYRCISLRSIKLPQGLVTMAGNTFAFCPYLRLIGLPNSITNLGGGSSVNGSSLGGFVSTRVKDIYIPRNVARFSYGNSAWLEHTTATNIFLSKDLDFAAAASGNWGITGKVAYGARIYMSQAQYDAWYNSGNQWIVTGQYEHWLGFKDPDFIQIYDEDEFFFGDYDVYRP